MTHSMSVESLLTRRLDGKGALGVVGFDFQGTVMIASREPYACMGMEGLSFSHNPPGLGGRLTLT